MQQFIPFDDAWDELDARGPGALVPYRFGVACAHAFSDDQRTGPGSPETSSTSPSPRPSFPAVPAFSSST